MPVHVLAPPVVPPIAKITASAKSPVITLFGVPQFVPKLLENMLLNAASYEKAPLPELVEAGPLSTCIKTSPFVPRLLICPKRECHALSEADAVSVTPLNEEPAFI